MATNRKQEGLSWTLAWCHEHCFKESTQELRNALFRYAQELGGEFRRFTKTKTFVEWLPQTTKPYVLVADWRTAKPCTLATTRHCFEERAISTVVHCTAAKQLKRARDWASSLMKLSGSSGGNFHPVDVTFPHILIQALQMPRGPHHVTSCHSGNLPALSDQLAQLATVEAAYLSQHTRPTVPSIQMEQQTRPKESRTQLHHHHHETRLRNDPVQTPQEIQSQAGHATRALTATNTADTMLVVGLVAPTMLVCAGVVDPRMAEVWTSLRCPKQVERALAAAVPDYYEE